MDSTKLRRNFGFFLTFIFGGVIGAILMNRRDWDHPLLGEISGVEFFVAIVAVTLAVIALFVFHNRYSSAALCVIVGLVVWFRDDIFGDVGWWGIAAIAAAIIVLLLLRSLTVGNARPWRFIKRQFDRMRFGRRPSHAAPARPMPVPSNGSVSSSTTPAPGPSGSEPVEWSAGSN